MRFYLKLIIFCFSLFFSACTAPRSEGEHRKDEKKSLDTLTVFFDEPENSLPDTHTVSKPKDSLPQSEVKAKLSADTSKYYIRTSKADSNSALFLPQNAEGGTALDHFFEALKKERRLQTVRVAHYGDSQLEGDRITSVLRRKLQERFGGTGNGFISFKDYAYHVLMTRKLSPGWRRYTVFQKRMSKSSYYGMGGSVFTFSGSKASAEFKFYKKPSHKKLFLVFGKAPDGFSLRYSDDKKGNLSEREHFPPDTVNTFKVYELRTDATDYLRLEFETEGQAPHIYGLYADGENTGVQVDNFALRGHSGGGLMRINQSFFRSQVNHFNTKLIILQYGANAVPYSRGPKQLAYIENHFTRIVKRLQKVAPNASILMVGVGDMAGLNENKKYVGFSHIEKFRDVQKRVAENTGIAFWDMLKFMGGRGSVFQWKRRGLAHYDGHLSNSGQTLIAKQLFKSLNEEYERYLASEKTEAEITNGGIAGDSTGNGNTSSGMKP